MIGANMAHMQTSSEKLRDAPFEVVPYDDGL